MILLDILGVFQTIIVLFGNDPFNDVTQVFALLGGISVAMRMIKKVSSEF